MAELLDQAMTQTVLGNKFAKGDEDGLFNSRWHIGARVAMVKHENDVGTAASDNGCSWLLLSA